MNENNKNNNDPIIFIIFTLLSEMILPLSKCPSDYDFRTDNSSEREFQATEKDSTQRFIGVGILGSVETHEQTNIVARQLQTISHVA